MSNSPQRDRVLHDGRHCLRHQRRQRIRIRGAAHLPGAHLLQLRLDPMTKRLVAGG